MTRLATTDTPPRTSYLGVGILKPCVSFVFRMCSWYFRGIMDYRKVSLLMVVLVHVVSMFVCAFV